MPATRSSAATSRRSSSQPAIRDRLLAEIDAVLDGCPLVLNLEGVTVPEMPTGLGDMQLAMPEALTLDWLKRLNVVAVSIANNHSHDLGDEPRAAMAAALRAAGIVVLDGVEAADLGPLRALALTDLDNSRRSAYRARHRRATSKR